MRTRHKKTHLSEAEINLTPLIDVCFVVLIMFIVVAPILEMERVDLVTGPPLDQHTALAITEKSPVSIHVYEDDSIAVNQQPVAIAQLKTTLTLIKSKSPTARPQIFHDRNAKFGTYQSVKNAVEAAGFTEMDLILKPE